MIEFVLTLFIFICILGGIGYYVYQNQKNNSNMLTTFGEQLRAKIDLQNVYHELEGVKISTSNMSNVISENIQGLVNTNNIISKDISSQRYEDNIFINSENVALQKQWNGYLSRLSSDTVHKSDLSNVSTNTLSASEFTSIGMKASNLNISDYLISKNVYASNLFSSNASLDNIHGTTGRFANINASSAIINQVKSENADMSKITSESLYSPYASVDFMKMNNMESSNAIIHSISSESGNFTRSLRGNAAVFSNIMGSSLTSESLNVSGKTVLSNTLQVNNDVNITGNLNVSGKVKIGGWNIQSSPDNKLLQIYKGSSAPKPDQTNTPLVQISDDGNVWTNRSILHDKPGSGWIADDIYGVYSNVQSLQSQVNASQQKLQVGAWSIQPTADSNFLQFYKGSTPPKSDQSDTPLVMMASDGNIWTNRSSLKGVGLTGWLADSLTMTRANDTQIQANLTNVQNQVNASQQKLQVGAWSIQPTADSNFLQFYKGSTPPKSDQSDTPLVMMASDGNIWTNRSSLKGVGLTGWLADSLTMTRANDVTMQNTINASSSNITNLQNTIQTLQKNMPGIGSSQLNGYVYLAGNVLLQWGQTYVDQSLFANNQFNVTIPFNKKFPSQVYTVNIQYVGDQSPYATTPQNLITQVVSSYTQTSFEVLFKNASHQVIAPLIIWMAIGI